MTAALVDHLWQSTWFAALAGLLTLVLRNNDARTRYWVWFAASLKFLVPFAWLTMLGGQFSWQISATPMSPGSLIDIVQAAGSLSAPPQLVTRAYSLNLAGVLIAVWAAGSLALLARWLVSWWKSASARAMRPCLSPAMNRRPTRKEFSKSASSTLNRNSNVSPAHRAAISSGEYRAS